MNPNVDYKEGRIRGQSKGNPNGQSLQTSTEYYNKGKGIGTAATKIVRRKTEEKNSSSLGHNAAREASPSIDKEPSTLEAGSSQTRSTFD